MNNKLNLFLVLDLIKTNQLDGELIINNSFDFILDIRHKDFSLLYANNFGSEKYVFALPKVNFVKDFTWKNLIGVKLSSLTFIQDPSSLLQSFSGINYSLKLLSNSLSKQINLSYPVNEAGYHFVCSNVDVFRYFSIANLDEIIDKLNNVNIKFQLFYINFIRNVEATSLKKIFGKNQFEIIRILSPLMDKCNRKYIIYFDLHRFLFYLNNTMINQTLSEYLNKTDEISLLNFLENIKSLLFYWDNNSEIVNKNIFTNLFLLCIQHALKYKSYYLRFTTYFDYVNMCNALKALNIAKFSLWPAILQIDYQNFNANIQILHDQVYIRYRQHQNEVRLANQKVLLENYKLNIYEKAKEFEMEFDEYSIIAPVDLSELITEGQVLNHCVGSYIQSVSQGNEYILFLRKKNDLTIPFFTLDITPDRKIRQIHGKYNCNLPKELEPIIQSWAKKYNLDISDTSGVKCALRY